MCSRHRPQALTRLLPIPLPPQVERTVDDWIESQIDEEEPNKWVAADWMACSCCSGDMHDEATSRVSSVDMMLDSQ